MSVKMRTTCTWTERPYEALLFPGIGFGPFLRSLGGRRRKPPSGGGPEPSVRYHSGRASILTLCQDLRAKGQSQVDSFYGAPASQKVTEACKGFLGPDGDWPSSAEAGGSCSQAPFRLCPLIVNLCSFFRALPCWPTK